MSDTTIITEQYVRINQTPASAGERFAAALLDIIFISIYIFLGFMTTSLIKKTGFSSDSLTAFSLFFIILPVLLYPVIFEIFNKGRTLGKIILGTRVVKIDGSTPSLGGTLLRWMLLLIDVTSGIGLLFIILTKNSQRIGDLAAGTIVIKDKSYRKIHVSLDEFNYLQKDYHPVYPQAIDLTINQADIITRILSLPLSKRREHAWQLSRKVQECLSVNPKENDPEKFLTTILHDYQYYLLEEI